MALHAEMGLPPPKPTYHPWGLKNSAAIFQKAIKSKNSTNLEKDLDSLIQFGKQHATNKWEALIGIQTDPDTGYGVQLPHDSTLINYIIYPRGPNRVLEQSTRSNPV